MNILDANEVRDFIRESKSTQNKDRKKHVEDGHRIATGDLDHFVEERLKALWAKSYQWFRRPNASLTQKVLNRIGKSYDESPDRFFGDEGKAQADYYEEIITNGDASLDKAMTEFDHTYILDQYAAIWVSPSKMGEKNKYIFRALNQSEFDRKVDKKTLETTVVMVSMSDSLNKTRIHGDGIKAEHIQDEPEDVGQKEYYALWTKEHHVFICYDMEKDCVTYEEIEGNEKNVNPSGRIPFEFLQDGDITKLPSRPSLPFNDVELNSCKAVLLTGCDVRALGKLIIKHPAKQSIPKEVYDSPFTFLDLPQSSDPNAAETTADYINDTTNVGEFKEVIADYEISLLEQEGIVSGQIGNVKFTSAEDRELALKSENDRIKRNQSKYAQVEKGVYRIVKAYEDALNNSKLKDDDIAIRYPKQESVRSRSQILDEIEKEINLGTIEPWEKHVRLNANMTEKEAKDKEERIQALKKENVQSFLTPSSKVDNADKENESNLLPKPPRGDEKGQVK